jgi:hypothetical protein
MVVIIVFIALGAKVISEYLQHKKQAPEPDDDDRIGRLEERVRVLEQIVTDSGYELRRQFRDLERDN